MKKISSLLLGLSLIALTTPTLAAPTSEEPIKIGYIVMGSKYGDFVLGNKNAAAMAVDEINKDGGIEGRPLQLVERDSKMDPMTAVKVTEDLITREKVSVLMNCDSSAATLAAINIAAKAKVPFINGCSEADSIVWDQGTPYGFRTNQGGYMWLSAVLDEATKRYGDKLKNKKWAILAPNFEWGQSLVKIMKMLNEERGMNATYVDEQWPPYDKLEAGATVAAMSHAKPDIILNLMFGSDLVKFVREGKKRALFQGKIVLAPATAMPDHIDMLKGEMPDGWVSIGFPVDEIQNPTFLAFKKDFDSRFKDPIRFYTVTGYSNVQAIAAALREAKSTEPQKVRNALEEVSFKTPFGDQHFRKIDHQASTPFWVGVTGLKDGKAALLDWHEESSDKHTPTDAWIMQQRKTTP